MHYLASVLRPASSPSQKKPQKLQKKHSKCSRGAAEQAAVTTAARARCIAPMDQTDLMAELSKAWQSVPYLSLALIVSAWTIGVFGLSILLDNCGDGESAADAITKLARRREFMKSHVV